MEDDKARREYYLNFRRRFFMIWFIMLITLGSLLIVTYGWRWRFFYNAKMTQFSICVGLDANGNPIPVMRPITVKAKEIDVCGYLEGNGPTIPLIFHFLYNGEAVVKPLTGYYQVGHLTTRFAAPAEGFKAGNYVILVYEGRHKLASTEFTIRGP